MAELEIKDPQSSKDIKLSTIFNAHFVKFLSQAGWSDSDIRDEFIALINSIVLSTKNNIALQKRMITFLNTAIKTLNIELKKLELQDDDSIVKVNKEQIPDVEDTIIESIKLKENCSKCEEKKKLLDQIKNEIIKFKKDMSNMGVDDDEITKLISLSLNFDKNNTKNKKYLLDRITKKLEACSKFYRENKKHSIREENKNNNEGESKEENGIKLAKPIEQTKNSDKKQSMVNKPEKKSDKKNELKKEKSVEKSKDNVEIGNEEINYISNEEKDVKINNTRVFFRNYLISDMGWDIDSADSIIESIFGLLKKGSVDLESQININKKIDEIEKFLKKSYPDDVIKLEKTKNFELAIANIKKLGLLFYKWNSKQFNLFKNNILTILSISKSANAQKVVSKTLTKI